jgi:beta-phosphoglucomutase family hydrolase
MRAKAFIFDMDGTMANNMAWHCKAWVELFRDEGVTVAEEEFMRLAGKTTRELIHTFIGKPVTDDECRHLAAQKEFLYRYMYRPHIKPVPGLRQFLRDARAKGIKIGVATAADPKNIEFTLENLKVKDLLDQVVGAAEVKHGKPEPDLFLLVAQKLGVDPRDCLVFEDAEMGFEAAFRAGMPAIAMITGHTREQLAQMNGVTSVADDFNDPVIRKLLRAD